MHSAFRQVMREYDASRNHAEYLLEKRKQQLHKDIPRMSKIEKRLGLLGVSLSRTVLSGDTKKLRRIRKSIEQLKEERRLLLAEHGLPEDYLYVAHKCKQCKDTGYIQESPEKPAVRCSCLQQKLILEHYALSNLDAILKEENFDTYDFRLFSDKIQESEGLSPLLNMQQVYNISTNFVEKFDSHFDNLYLYGEAGLGKTFVCHCIAKDLLDMGRSVLYLTAPRLCKVIEDYRFNRESLSAPDEMIEAIDSVDLLIIDDLGTEFSTSVTSSALFDIINQRLILRRHTIVSTNLAPNALKCYYTERLVSRFYGSYQLVKFFGADLRMEKKYKKIRI